MTASAACESLENFTAAHELAAIECDPALAEAHRVLVAQCSGADPSAYHSHVDDELAANAPLAVALNGAQAQAWKALLDASHGRLELRWDTERGTPGLFRPGILLSGTDGVAARADLEAQAGNLIEALFQTGSTDVLVPAYEQSFALGQEPGATQVHAWRYDRSYAGLPVFGDGRQIVLETSERCADRWVATLSSRWTRDLASLSLQPAISSNDAVAAAQLSGDVPNGAPARPVVLEIDALTTPPILAYQVWLGNEQGDRFLYHVSAHTGAVVAKDNQVAENGSVEIYAGRPHDGLTKTPRPLQFANLHAYSIQDAAAPIQCGAATADQRHGDPAWYLEQTDPLGAYANGWPGSLDLDYRGLYAYDRSAVTVLDTTFLSGGPVTLPQETTYLRSRRGEIYYLLTSAARQYADGAIDQWLPVQFWFYTGTGTTCSNPGGADDCCGGFTSGQCFQVYCEGEIGVVGPNEFSERQFRYVTLHEHNHTLRFKQVGSLCGGNNECSAWEEGRADFGAIAMSRFEKARPEYTPTRSYPTDYPGGCLVPCYTQGSIWTAIYAQFLQEAGARTGILDVNWDVRDVTYSANTIMVGSCADANQNGCVEISECPQDSFFQHLLDADTSLFGGHGGFEISHAFHDHVTDADKAAPGVQTFPYADEMPDWLEVPPFVALELGSQIGVTVGPDAHLDPNGGALGFSSLNDHDSVTFLARAGESYFIETTNLASGVDTYLEVLDKPVYRGDSPVLASNDNCGRSLRSCLTFTPQTGGYYRVRVRPTSGSAVGCGKSYQLWLTMLSDDYGDTRDNAGALAADNVARSAQLDTATDVDWFKLASSAAQTLRYHACSSALSSVTAELWDAAGATALDSYTTTSCSDPDRSFSVGSGVYFLRVSSPAAPGPYQVQALLTSDIDLDSSAANAWTLTTDATSGRVLGSRFETGSDADDWYQFTAAAEGDWFLVETFGLGPGVGTTLELYTPPATLYGRTGTIDSMPDSSGGNGLGHWMLQNADGALINGGARIAFQAPVPGTYYVRVKNRYATAGRYYLAFDDAGQVLRTGWLTGSMGFP